MRLAKLSLLAEDINEAERMDDRGEEVTAVRIVQQLGASRDEIKVQ